MQSNGRLHKQTEKKMIESTMTSTSRAYLPVNVILTFAQDDPEYGTQDIFDIQLPVNRNEANAVEFINKKLFKRIAQKCHQFGRDPKQLIKISTGANWSVFAAKTGQRTLPDLGHPCKWYFGVGRDDLDIWEESLMHRYEFGVDVDMSWMKRMRAEMQLAQPGVTCS
jgi:hypothetical protein